MERLNELESLIEQTGLRLEKAMAYGSEREVSELRKELKKFTAEKEEIEAKENACACKV